MWLFLPNTQRNALLAPLLASTKADSFVWSFATSIERDCAHFTSSANLESPRVATKSSRFRLWDTRALDLAFDHVLARCQDAQDRLVEYVFTERLVHLAGREGAHVPSQTAFDAVQDFRRFWKFATASHLAPITSRLTLRISCEAVPPSIPPAGAQGGTLSCRTGAALSFVSCIRLLGDALLRRHDR
jgi:hypothetical protein